MNEQNFEVSYARLNKKQKEAVDSVEGAVMVVAGPGTGKTQILTLRIANILKQTDAEPSSVLALTFTESGVRSMRKRLVSFVGEAGYRVRISTYHSFANSIIEQYPEFFESIIGAEAATDIDQIQILEEIIVKGEFEKLKPFGDNLYYIPSILNALSGLKREGLTPEMFSQVVETEEDNFSQIEDLYNTSGKYQGKMKGKYQKTEKQILKNKELVFVYEKYQEIMKERKLYDFSDMVIEVVAAMKRDEGFKLMLQEDIQYILVDEHQDTNNAQNMLVELLMDFHDNPNLFVVGDEKQSIFRFQGASLENFYYIKHKYPQVKLVTLTTNYRSSQSILDSSYDVVAPMLLEDQKLEAFQDFENHPISVMRFPDDSHELYGIGEHCKNLIDSGVPAHEIAILYRSNREAIPFSRVFENMEIPYQVESKQARETSGSVKALTTILHGVHSFPADEPFVKMLALSIFKIDPIDLAKIIKKGSQKRKGTIADVIVSGLKDLVLSKPEAITSAFSLISSWKTKATEVTVDRLCEEIMRTSGLLESVLSDFDHEEYERLNQFFSSLRNFVGERYLSQWVEQEEVRARYKKKSGFSAVAGREGKVRLMTAHASKGMEFDHVIIPGVFDGNWGNKRRVNTLPLLAGVYSRMEDNDGDEKLDYVWEPNHDERRLLYVALTRARKTALATFGQMTIDGKERIASQFLAEINPELLSHSDEEERHDVLLSVLGNSNEEEDGTIKERFTFYVSELFEKSPLSVSALNTYLKDPWQYIFKSLLRIPSEPNKFQAYGIAVHAALQDLFDEYRQDESPSSEWLVGQFTEHLDSQYGFDDITYREMLSKGAKALPAWFDEYSESWNTNTKSELRVNGVHVHGIRLTGVLDKLEMLGEGSRDVVVVDYKTGKAKTRGEIMGTTKTSNGDYYRQLVFYKLLLDEYQVGKYNMVFGEIDFVEPDAASGKLRKEQFQISAEDVEDLRETISLMKEDITSGAFFDKEPDEKVCEFLELVNKMKGRK